MVKQRTLTSRPAPAQETEGRHLIPMGEHNVEQQIDEKKSQAFMKALLEDLRALEFMIETDRFETGITRIGAEQEMFLVDRNMRPAPISLEVLQRADEPRLTRRGGMLTFRELLLLGGLLLLPEGERS